MEVLFNLSLNLQSPRFSTVGNRASLQPTSPWLISPRPLLSNSSLSFCRLLLCARGIHGHECRLKLLLVVTPWTQSDNTYHPTPFQVKRKVAVAPEIPRRNLRRWSCYWSTLGPLETGENRERGLTSGKRLHGAPNGDY